MKTIILLYIVGFAISNFAYSDDEILLDAQYDYILWRNKEQDESTKKLRDIIFEIQSQRGCIVYHLQQSISLPNDVLSNLKEKEQELKSFLDDKRFDNIAQAYHKVITAILRENEWSQRQNISMDVNNEVDKYLITNDRLQELLQEIREEATKFNQFDIVELERQINEIAKKMDVLSTKINQTKINIKEFRDSCEQTKENLQELDSDRIKKINLALNQPEENAPNIENNTISGADLVQAIRYLHTHLAIIQQELKNLHVFVENARKDSDNDEFKHHLKLVLESLWSIYGDTGKDVEEIDKIYVEHIDNEGNRK